MTTREEVADRLDKAHDELLIQGWCQLTLRDESGKLCSVGGIWAAQGWSWNPGVLPTEPMDMLSDIVYELLTDEVDRLLSGYESLPSWNDALGRTLDEVLDLFRNTAKAVREGEHDARILQEERHYQAWNEACDG